MSRPSRPKALDLFCGGGGISVGLARAGFEVTGVDINPAVEPYWRRGMAPYGGTFVCADALAFPLEGFDLVCASPPCQAYSVLRHLVSTKGKEYPDLIDAVRERLQGAGAAWCIENVPGAPLGSVRGLPLVLLCGTMFGLQTADGRAELRRHRLFETSFSIPLRPACQHGDRLAVSVTGHDVKTVNSHLDSRPERKRTICVAGGKAMSGGMMTPPGELKRRTISVTGNMPQTNVVRNQVRETYSVDDARHAMGIPWLPQRLLNQAIPPIYATWIGQQALSALGLPLAGDDDELDGSLPAHKPYTFSCLDP